MRAVVIFRCICESAGEGILKDMTCHPIWTKPYSSTLMGSKLRHQFKNNNRVSRSIYIFLQKKVHYFDKCLFTYSLFTISTYMLREYAIAKIPLVPN